MYSCKQSGSADLPSTVGWLGGSMKGGGMQIQIKCATEPSYFMGNVESGARFEGSKRTRKEDDNEGTCDGAYWYSQAIIPIRGGNNVGPESMYRYLSISK